MCFNCTETLKHKRIIRYLKLEYSEFLFGEKSPTSPLWSKGKQNCISTPIAIIFTVHTVVVLTYEHPIYSGWKKESKRHISFTSGLIPVVLFTRQATACQKHWITCRRLQKMFNLAPAKGAKTSLLSDPLPTLTHDEELHLTSGPSCTVSSLRVTLSSNSKPGSGDLGDHQPINKHTFKNLGQIKPFPWLFTFHLDGQLEAGVVH